MAEEDDELLGMFVQEATEHLETIEPDLLTLEEQGDNTDPEIINRLFRSVHSIKGSAGFFGLSSITKLSHTMENLLGKVREKSMTVTPAVTDSLLSGLDKLQTMIHDVSASESVDASEQIATIQAILEGSGGAAPKPAAPPPAPAPAAPPPPPPKPEPEPEPEVHAASASGGTAKKSEIKTFDLTRHPDAVNEAVTHGRRFFSIAIDLPEGKDERVDLFNTTKSLMESVGSIVATDPPFQSNKELETLSANSLSVLLSTVLEDDLLLSLLQVDNDHIQKQAISASVAQAAKQGAPVPAPVKAVASAKPRDDDDDDDDAGPHSKEAHTPRLKKPKYAPSAKRGAAAKPGTPANKSSSPTVEETLRVSVSLLDELINNAGELVLARNQLSRAAVEVQAKFPHFGPLVQNLDSITSRIQERVMQARMQPVSVVFNKFPRIVRDLAHKLGKKIDLELRGGDVDLDKSVIEHLSDPLTHMIRNVADHAIEMPQDRLASNKPEAGQVELAAYHENGMVNISLADDGAGIDAERVKTKALERGLITERQADTMSEEDALDLIFAPGFSMAKKVSDVSGRGVGMDVVRTNIEKLGGTVQILSKVGKGTNIILKLPLTLAIIPAMIVSAGNQRFAIPEIGLVEIVRVAESERAQQIEIVGSAPVLRLRNMLLPLVDLTDVLNIPRVLPDGASPDRRERFSDRRNGQRKAQDAADGKDGRRDIPPASDRRDPHTLVAYVMVLNVGGNEFGMVVDEVLDSEEIVVKPLPSFFKDNPCFSATTILGDGSVSLIIDYAGLMEQAKINFSNVERATRMDLDEERRAALRERQNIILLETGTGLIMGIVHSMVRRVEKISPKLLDTIGGLPYVRYDGKTFRAIYPDHVLGLEGMGLSRNTMDPEEEEDLNLCMVVPNIPDIQAGLIFSRIIDTRETNIDLDCRAIQAPGLFGSAQIDDRVVLFPDVNAVFEMAGIRPPWMPPQVEGAGFRALVVDDTPFLRVLTSNYLSSVGFDVDQAEDGQAAIGMLNRGDYDLLVTDLNMPVMDGFELANELNGTPHAEIPMIATTSSISSELEDRCARAGFVSCVPAIDKNRLLKVVSTLRPR
ncbi:Two-component system, chemotaxis family, sensor kinase CheA [Candidatus Magnetaquicoccaceae bacterium FCR-1]|uniref:histidine kinase n=1 Tax=Candidatus Magnetaquiglobus chichijimensis TaxID=3141448 RepID=A0ABQ0C5F2_9PROT